MASLRYIFFGARTIADPFGVVIDEVSSRWLGCLVSFQARARGNGDSALFPSVDLTGIKPEAFDYIHSDYHLPVCDRFRLPRRVSFYRTTLYCQQITNSAFALMSWTFSCLSGVNFKRSFQSMTGNRRKRCRR